MSFLRCLSLALLLSAPAALAQDTRLTAPMVRAALVEQGYVIESSVTTLLGRVRIIASRDGIWREVVLDASRGQILRDYAVEFSPADSPDPDARSMPRGGKILQDKNELPLRN